MDDKDRGASPEESPIGRVVEGPVRLVVGQNFYAQFPFSEIIDPRAASSEIEISDIRHLLTRMSDNLLRADRSGKRDRELARLLESDASVAYYLPSSYKKKQKKEPLHNNIH